MVTMSLYLAPFSRYGEISVENRKFEPTPPPFGAPVGGDPRWIFADIFGIRKLEYVAIVWRCLRDHTFSRFGTVPTVPNCDKQTDRHTKTAYAALAWRRAVKS